MINELIAEKTKNGIMLFLFVVSMFILTWGIFRLGMVYICNKSDMTLILEPKVKCVSEEEIKNIKNPYWWIHNESINKTFKPIY